MAAAAAINKDQAPPRRGRPPKSPDAPDMKRVAFPLALLKVIEDLQAKTGALSTTDVFRDALRVYAYLSEAHLAGKDIIIKDPSGAEKSLALFMPLGGGKNE